MLEAVLIIQEIALLGLTVTSILLAHKLLRLDREMTEFWRDLKITHWRVGSEANRSEGTSTLTSSKAEKP